MKYYMYNYRIFTSMTIINYVLEIYIYNMKLNFTFIDNFNPPVTDSSPKSIL